MRFTMIFAAVLASASFPSHGAGLGNYSFDYTITGDRAVRPVQVFDDGRAIYIQLPVNMAAPPAVLEKVGEQVRPIRFRYEFPYLVVDNARGEIVLAFDGRTARVTKRSSGVVTGASTSAVITGAATQAAPVAPAQPRPADRSDYSGEMVFRQMRGSSLPPASQPVRVAAAPVRSPAPATSVPPRERSAAPARAPNAAPRHYAAAGQDIKTIVHRVRSGETLGRVAAQYGVPASRIAVDNGITNPNLIRVGQALAINKPGRTIMASADPVRSIAAVAAPVRSPAPATSAPSRERGAAPASAPSVAPQHYAAAGQGIKTIVHRVRIGESLGRIAAQYGVLAHRVAADNGITNPNLIRVGQALTINKPDRTIMASANPVQNIAAVAAPVRSPAPAVMERAAPSVRVAMTAPHAAPSFASIAPSQGILPDMSPSGRVGILRVFGVSPKIDAQLLAAVQRVVGQQGEVMLRGHSSAKTTGERSATANASAEAVRDQLIENGIPADRLTLVSNPGRVMSPSRVDVVLIGSKESVDA